MQNYQIYTLWLALLFLLIKPPSATATATATVSPSAAAVEKFVPAPYSFCRLGSVKESLLGSFDRICPLTLTDSWYSYGVVEGGEDSLHQALNMVNERTRDYVAILFYASWCPFSGTFRPTFSTLSYLFPSIPHFAIEESSVRPSILPKYGVRGFPTLVLLNSTMQVRFSGSRTLDSLTAFYLEITGMKKVPIDGKYLDKIGCLSDNLMKDSDEMGSCPFPWTRSPENNLRQETYLALATAFVLLRLLHIIFPALRKLSHFSARYMNIRFRSFREHLLGFLNRAVQLLNSLKVPRKRSNLQGGALNANTWASKIL